MTTPPARAAADRARGVPVDVPPGVGPVPRPPVTKAPGDASHPVPAPPAGGPRAARERGTAWWARVPLVARLVGIISVLLALGLVLAGVAATTLLQRNLVGQVDTKLQTEGHSLAQSLANTLRAGEASPFGETPAFETPSDYYVRISTDVWGDQSFHRSTVIAEYGTPKIPDLTTAQITARHGQPFTVGSTKPGSQWRVVMYSVTVGSVVVGDVAVALPLGEIQHTVRSMVVALALTGLGILLIGGVVGAWAVRRSLRPLGEIEDTAAAIAAGDLSRRVPPAPASTEVGRLGIALNGMLAQIEHAFDARTASEARMRRFVADASHELRTPLATIRGYGELYRMGALTTKDQVDDTMRRIEGSATRMGSLVEDLLALARLDEGRPLHVGAVDLTVLGADAISDLHALDPSRAARLVPLVPGAAAGPCVVRGEESRLRQVLANLVGNVVQHTPAGTPVEVAVGAAAAADGTPRGVVEVRDHGPGIDPEHAARVFERFYRVDASRGRDSGGAGLGMAIVAAIVDAHGGEVSLAQTEGGGTTVRVALPVPASGAGTDEAASGSDDGAAS